MSNTREHVLQTFPTAVEWLASVGVVVSEGRFSDYESTRGRMMLGDAASGRASDVDLHMVSEMALLVGIYDWRKELVQLPWFTKTVRKLSGGRDLYAHDTEDRQARDAQFELESACRLLSYGIALLPNSVGDLEAQVDDARVLVECKRPTSDRAVKERIRKGLQQVNKRRRAHPAGVGLIVVDLTVLLNPDLTPHKVATPEEARAQAKAFVDLNTLPMAIRFQRRLTHLLDAGVLARVRVPMFNIQSKTFYQFDLWWAWTNQLASEQTRRVMQALSIAASNNTPDNALR